MPDVVILRGVSGSGKTTFAKRMPRVRICATRPTDCALEPGMLV